MVPSGRHGSDELRVIRDPLIDLFRHATALQGTLRDPRIALKSYSRTPANCSWSPLPGGWALARLVASVGLKSELQHLTLQLQSPEPAPQLSVIYSLSLNMQSSGQQIATEYGRECTGPKDRAVPLRVRYHPRVRRRRPGLRRRRLLLAPSIRARKVY